jgi:hypothetical protein
MSAGAAIGRPVAAGIGVHSTPYFPESSVGLASGTAAIMD